MPAHHVDRSPLPIDEEITSAYAFLCGSGNASVEQIAAALEIGIERARQLVGRLTELHLIDSAGDGTYTPGSPRALGAGVIAPAIRQLESGQQQIIRMMTELDALTKIYERSPAERLRRPRIEILPEVAAVRAVLTELSAGARTEILTSQPGGARPADVLRESLERTEAVLSRGITMRTVYQHTAQFSQVTVDYVRHVTERGVEVRMLSDALMRMIIFDREIAVLPQYDRDGAVVVSDRSIVDFAVQAFERAWPVARPFPVSYDRGQVKSTSVEIQLSISRLLVEGLEDKVIARRMGMSLRTCQRHISEIMSRIGARNRMHAGYLLGKLIDSQN
ncbi:LuxR C-terminal-related transcriptional regulator [Streptomyces sp. NPDC058155]|uniref:LuxR C-terminal-related transcriptional regulator n=1 Tax=Streptomyces sp. NPDC058155 TaxID=3346359 RepID=UPI0036E4CC3A